MIKIILKLGVELANSFYVSNTGTNGTVTYQKCQRHLNYAHRPLLRDLIMIQVDGKALFRHGTKVGMLARHQKNAGNVQKRETSKMRLFAF